MIWNSLGQVPGLRDLAVAVVRLAEPDRAGLGVKDPGPAVSGLDVASALDDVALGVGQEGQLVESVVLSDLGERLVPLGHLLAGPLAQEAIGVAALP